MNEIEVDVTTEDLENSTYLDGEGCGIALGLKRMGYRGVSVGGSTVTLDGVNYTIINSDDIINGYTTKEPQKIKLVKICV